MKIAINLLSIQSPYSGAAVYAFNILNQLLKNCGDLNISIFCQDAIKSKLTELKLYPSNSAKIKFCFFEFQSIYHRIFFEQYKFIKILNSEKFDILHSFSNICPIHYKKPQILTLHDIIFQKYPTRYTFAKKIYYSYFIKKSISAANKILVPTQTTADDLIEYYNIEKNKIIIIPYSINFFLTNIQISELKKEDIKKKIGLPNNYFLFVGALEPGKNINFLIKLMNEFIEKYSADYKIVIVGNKGWKYKLADKKYIVLLEKLNYEELKVVYENAKILLYPSLYEGVGLPVIEAQYFQIPVICSDYPAAKEIINCKNILPLDINAWLIRINAIIKNEFDWKTNETIQYEYWSEYCEKLKNIYLSYSSNT